jgi:hypothetical protein
LHECQCFGVAIQCDQDLNSSLSCQSITRIAT